MAKRQKKDKNFINYLRASEEAKHIKLEGWTGEYNNPSFTQQVIGDFGIKAKEK